MLLVVQIFHDHLTGGFESQAGDLGVELPLGGLELGVQFLVRLGHDEVGLALAFATALSTTDWALSSACLRMAAAWVRASATMPSPSFLARSSACRPWSAEAMPSAIWVRPLFEGTDHGRPDDRHGEPDEHQEGEHFDDQGGIDVHDRNLSVTGLLGDGEDGRHKGIGEGEEQRHTDADHRDGVQQAGNDEHLHLQRARQLG